MQLEVNSEYISPTRDGYENFSEKMQECLDLNLGFAIIKFCYLWQVT